MIQVFESGIYSISPVKDGCDTYFRAKDIAKVLGYQDTANSVRDHDKSDYRKSFRDLFASTREIQSSSTKLDGSDLNAIYLSEPGLYRLICSSKLPQA